MKSKLSIWKGVIRVQEPLREVVIRVCKRRNIAVSAINNHKRTPGLVSIRNEVCYEAAKEGYQDQEIAEHFGRHRSWASYSISRHIEQGFGRPLTTRIVLAKGEAQTRRVIGEVARELHLVRPPEPKARAA